MPLVWIETADSNCVGLLVIDPVNNAHGLLKILHLYDDYERFELFCLQPKICLQANNQVQALVFTFEVKEELSVTVQLRAPEPEMHALNGTKTSLKKVNLQRQNIIEFFRTRFLGGDITMLEFKLQKTEAEALELRKYREAKRQLQKNLFQIWKKRVEVVNNFQKQKAEKEVKQSIFFRDNFKVRTALKEILGLQRQSHANRNMFVLGWKSIICFFKTVRKMVSKTNETRFKFHQRKMKIRQIIIFFRKLAEAERVGKLRRQAIAKQGLVNGFRTLHGTQSVVGRQGLATVIGGLLKQVLGKLTLQKTLNSYSNFCKLKSYEIRENGYEDDSPVPSQTRVCKDSVCQHLLSAALEISAA